MRIKSLTVSGPRLLVRPLKEGEVKVGALYLPEEAKGDYALTVVEVVHPGTGEYIISTGGRSLPLYAKGDHLLLMRVPPLTVRVGDEDMKLIPEKEVLGRVETEADAPALIIA